MKTIKIMSDGNIARVGMICAYIENDDPLRIEIGVITHIKPSNRNELTNIIDESDLLFKPINAIYNWGAPSHYASLGRLSKATPEQKKLYWLELEKQTIQFRPEFEAKLKELGIRDQFINNLFDPKWKVFDPKIKRQDCLNATTWISFINHAFVWCLSPEGDDYWRDISFK